MRVSRFAPAGRMPVILVLALLSAVGLYACLHALGVLAGVFPVGRLPPYPAWTASHFISSIIFVVLLPLQLWPALRARAPRLHRLTGRVAVAVATIMALSGIAMALTSPQRPVSEQIFMVLFFAGFCLMLWKGLAAARARNIVAHRAWMARMTISALTPLVQRLVFPILAASFGVGSLAEFWELFITAAWISWGITLAAGEWWARTAFAPARPRRSAQPAPALAA